MMKAALPILLAAVLLAFQSVAAVPTIWLSRPNTCGKQPNQAFGPHRAPRKDTKIVFTVTPAAGGAAIKANGTLRAGTRYIVRAKWTTTQINHALLTTSLGSLAVTTGAPASCKLSAATVRKANSYNNTLILPTTAKGKVTLSLTHSAPGLPYLQNSVTFNVLARTTGKRLF